MAANDLLLDVILDGGKYRVQQKATDAMHALRHGKEWRDLTGDGLIHALASEVSDLRDQLVASEERAVIAEQKYDELNSDMAYRASR